jgi:hypothetical protein
MSVGAAVMDDDAEVSSGTQASDADTTTSPLIDRDDGSPFDILQRAVSQIPCRQTQMSLGHVVHMMHGMEANLLKLMQHLGVTPVIQSRLNMVSLRSSSSSPQCISPSLKPQCPFCRSSNFGCEKHFVQHLCTAIDHLNLDLSGKPWQRKSSCLFSSAKHSAMMGMSAGAATFADGIKFITGYKNCFVAGEISGFDAERCRNAADFLASAEAVPSPMNALGHAPGAP